MGSVADHVFLCDDARDRGPGGAPGFRRDRRRGRRAGQNPCATLLTLGPAEVGRDPDRRVRRGWRPAPLRRARSWDEEEIAWVQYTGGTTGRPKGGDAVAPGAGPAGARAARSRGVCRSGRATWRPLRSPTAAVLPVLPTLGAGRDGGAAPLVRPGALAAERGAGRRSTTPFRGADHGSTRWLDRRRSRGAFDTSSLESLVYGAAPECRRPGSPRPRTCSAGPPVVMQAYGTDRVHRPWPPPLRKDEQRPPAPTAAAVLLWAARSPVVRVELLDDDGTAVPHGDVGELSVRSRVLMSGYRGRPEENRRRCWRDGWPAHRPTWRCATRRASCTSFDRKKDMIVNRWLQRLPQGGRGRDRRRGRRIRCGGHRRT